MPMALRPPSAIAAIHAARRNRILGTLPEADFLGLLPDLEPMQVLVGDVLCESSAQMTHAFFPTTFIVSLQYVMENGSSAEIAGVGNEGVLGVPLFMGGESMLSRSVVQTGGAGFRLRQSVLVEQFNGPGALMRGLLRYTQIGRAHV